MALQLALTTLESLAEMLNERKRECEQVAAFTEKLHTLGGKIGPRDSREARPGQARMLLREDDVQRLEFNPAGQVGIMLYCIDNINNHGNNVYITPRWSAQRPGGCCC